jgi:DNA-binding MarR family transcriptional regulator
MTQAQAEDVTTAIIETISHYYRAVQLRLPTDAPGIGAVTREQWFVLLEVVKKGPDGLSMGELAGRQGMALNSATALVDRLVNAGLLERRPDLADRRVVRITATRAGGKLKAAISAVRRAEYQRLLAELSEEETAALRAAMPALAHLAEAVSAATRR